jgi:uncharacterized membrane protein YeaQ/YmgE (transglycosylase-associated protein family)
MTITGIVSTLLIGILVGVLGRLVVPGHQRISIWLTILVGIVAAFAGTWVARLMGLATGAGGINWMELLVQVVLAAIGVALVTGLAGRSQRRFHMFR